MVRRSKRLAAKEKENQPILANKRNKRDREDIEQPILAPPRKKQKSDKAENSDDETSASPVIYDAEDLKHQSLSSQDQTSNDSNHNVKKNSVSSNKRAKGRPKKVSKEYNDEAKKELLEAAVGAQFYSGNKANAAGCMNAIQSAVTFEITHKNIQKELKRMNKEYVKTVNARESGRTVDGTGYLRTFKRTNAHKNLSKEWFKYYEAHIGGETLIQSIKPVDNAKDAQNYADYTSKESKGRRELTAKQLFTNHNAKSDSIAQAADSITQKNSTLNSLFILSQQREYAKVKASVCIAFQSAIQDLKDHIIFVGENQKEPLKEQMKNLQSDLKSDHQMPLVITLGESLKDAQDKGDMLIKYLLALAPTNLDDIFDQL